MRKTALFFAGITNAGKSTVIGKMSEFLGHRYKVGLVEVGKEMRKRHSPEFFKGKGAMPETEAEAFGIFTDQFDAAASAETDFILIDGQPRMASQVQTCIPHAIRKGYDCYLVLVTVGDEEAKERALKRDSDPAAVELSMKRLTNDKIQLFDVLCACLAMHGVTIIDVNSHMSVRQTCLEIPQLRAALL